MALVAVPAAAIDFVAVHQSEIEALDDVSTDTDSSDYESWSVIDQLMCRK
jgi:hypothetical protein